VIWSPDEVLTAVRSRLGLGVNDSGWTFERADLDGEKVLVIFHVDDGRRFGVHYDLAEVPMGNNTGLLCDTPEDRADEIDLTMDEQILTGGVARAERTVRADGLTVLSWVW
jgi:hypothetical protein